LRLASSPASNQLCSQPSWTRFSSSPRLPALRRCHWFRLRFPFGPASDQPCGRPLGTCIRLSSPAPALRRCRRLGLRLAFGPASNWSPARAFSSTSGLNLQLLTACRFSGRRRALVRTRVLRFMPFGLSLFLGPSVSPSVRPLGRSRGLRSPAEVRSSLRLRFRSTFLPPSGSGARRWARALRLLPFLPASLLACFSPVLRLSPPRLRSEAALWHAFGHPSPPACACGFVWPSCWLLTQPSGNRPEACASADCSGLAAFTSCGCQLPQGLWTTGLSIPKNLRSAESALSPAPACVRLAPRAALEPASQSCLGVPVIAEVRLAPRSNLPGLPFPDGALASFHPSGAFRTVLETSACAAASRPILPDLPSGSGPPAPGLRPARSVRPSSLPSRLPFGLASSSLCSGSAAGSIG
jgi:hypothetical protein